MAVSKANIIKSVFIDYILSQIEEDIIIGNEVMYGSTGKIADLILLHKGSTYAIEIKSDADNLNRIKDQITEYQKQFDYTIVVSGEKHTDKLSKLLPDGIGLYMVSDDLTISLLHRAKRQRKLNKDEMLFSIKTSYLVKIADFSTNEYNADEIRHQFTKKRTSCIQEILYNYWSNKLKPGFECFMSERGEETIVSDLSNFTSYKVSTVF